MVALGNSHTGIKERSDHASNCWSGPSGFIPQIPRDDMKYLHEHTSIDRNRNMLTKRSAIHGLISRTIGDRSGEAIRPRSRDGGARCAPQFSISKPFLWPSSRSVESE